jgi:hypothetical protein
MFNYYRFIKSKYSAVADILVDQAKRDQILLRVIENFNINDEDRNRITVIVINDVIIDIYRG